VLGAAFKGGTDDIRESPAVCVIEALLREGCQVAMYDPAAAERVRELLADRITYAVNPYEAAAGADALLILTDWEEFTAIDLDRVHALLRYPIVIDGRNLYDPEMMAARGFFYYCVGRPEALPHAEQPAEAGSSPE
jgi:UDPglucose 6-dehydrogenase